MGLRRLVAIAVLATSTRAGANPIEILGLTSRRAGQANTGVASADDASALYYDPALLAVQPGGDLALGTVAAAAHLRVGAAKASLSDHVGFQLAARVHLPLGGRLADRIAVGVALHLLPRNVARVIAPPPDRAFYPYYGDRLSRIVVLPGAAVRLGHGITAGAAVNVLAGLKGSIYATEGALRAIDARVDERVPTVARLIAGVAWQKSPALRLGLVYRQRFEIPFQTTAETLVAGEPIDLDLRASGQFSPHQVAAGAAWQTDVAQVSFDAIWAHWSGYPGPYVLVDSKLPLVGPVPGQPPHVPFHDTISVRLGLETVLARGEAGATYRFGYGFESSPVPAAQTGVTNLLDGPKHLVGLGAGYTWPHAAGGKPLRIDAHFQLQLVTGREFTKTLYNNVGPYDPYTTLRDEDANVPDFQTSNPGYPTIKSGGEVASGGVTLEVGL